MWPPASSSSLHQATSAKDNSGNATYGRIHSPGNSPYVITVGATNTYGTLRRNDDVITSYSSSGPTRSYYTNAAGTKVYDNLIKPDLVAPGNKLSVVRHLVLDGDQEGQRHLDGLAHRCGAAALLMQENPNLTPGMVKAILEYSAQPMVNVDMFKQGSGQLNVDGAVRISRVLRHDVNFQSSLNGTSMLSLGSSLPNMNSTIGCIHVPVLAADRCRSELPNGKQPDDHVPGGVQT